MRQFEVLGPQKSLESVTLSPTIVQDSKEDLSSDRSSGMETGFNSDHEKDRGSSTRGRQDHIWTISRGNKGRENLAKAV